MEFAGVMALVILAVANLNVLGSLATGTADAVVGLAHRWHGFVTTDEAAAAVELDGTNVQSVAVDLSGPSVEAVLSRQYSLETRKAALYALAESGMDESKLLAILERVALQSVETELAKAAVYLVTDVQSEGDAVASLRRILEGSSHVQVRKAAVYALGEFESAEARAALLDAVGMYRG